MFCVVDICERKSTFKEKLFWRFIKDEYVLQTIPVYKGAPFYKLNITVGRKGIDWEYVSYCTGKCGGRLLLESEINLPKSFGLGRYSNNVLYNKMMQNTFLYIIKQQKQIYEDLCFFDKEAKGEPYLLKLVPYFKRICVVTENKEEYLKVCDRILEETGLSVELHSETNNRRNIIDFDRCEMQINTENKAYTINKGENFSVPEIYGRLYDTRVEKTVFYSALYEFCGIFELAELIFSSIQVNGEKKDANEVIFT